MTPEKPTIDYAAILADLEAKKAAIESLIASFKTAAASGALVMGETPVGAGMPYSATTQAISSIQDIPNGAFHGKSITEASKIYLGMIKKKQTTREIAEALLRGGMETTSDRFQTNVHGILLRAGKEKHEIVRIGNAWGLAEWYPASMRSSQPKNGQIGPKGKRGRPKTIRPEDAYGKVLAGATPVSLETEGLEARILAVLTREQMKPFSAEEIAEKVNATSRGVHLNLGRMKKAGKIEVNDGKYRLKPHPHAS
jgi:hypothetical protein